MPNKSKQEFSVLITVLNTECELGKLHSNKLPYFNFQL